MKRAVFWVIICFYLMFPIASWVILYPSLLSFDTAQWGLLITTTIIALVGSGIAFFIAELHDEDLKK